MGKKLKPKKIMRNRIFSLFSGTEVGRGANGSIFTAVNNKGHLVAVKLYGYFEENRALV